MLGSPDDWKDLLETAPATLRREIEKRARSIRATKGRTIFSVRARGDEVLFVAEGKVQVLRYSVSGREVSVNNLGPGDSFGQLAVLDGLPRSASVIALTDVRLRAIGRDDFLLLLEASSRAGIWVARRLCGDVRRLSERVFELSALNVQSRLYCELLRLARSNSAGRLSIDPAPTHADLASRIGATREAVTREIRILAKSNIIRTHRRGLEFVDLAELERLVHSAVGTIEETLFIS